ncbi:hypothetical protein BGZ70_005848 [Mortierella alpina]|uniref:Fungal lipase-type domain-containing protein n=1 Tax=Mortierella alpina TaxID=64518 RepID=A0A9P6J8T6_MORAP|nr:hypothetical protein BGZ70_005848 [Mortierella alpina]
MVWSVDCSNLADTHPLGHKEDSEHHHLPLPFPEKFPISEFHLREFRGSRASDTPTESLLTAPSINSTTSSSSASTAATLDGSQTAPLLPESYEEPLKERISVKPMDFCNYVLDGLALYIRNLRNPSTIPGKSLWSRTYAMGVLPALIGILIFCQTVITTVIIWSSYTTLGRKAFQLFLKDQILLFDSSDTVDPHGTREALRQLADTQPRTKPVFNYHIANLLLTLSTLTYERDDNLVKSASTILRNIQSEQQKIEAAQLLVASEQTIDSKAKLLGMRFLGVSELKSLGGPFAGLFYNDETIILAFKGTSVLAFNEYLIDATIQRVKAHEYLYGEVHKGFYESLFPDPAPVGCYEKATLDKTNPFNTIMDTIFGMAASLKEKAGKPVNLWMTGHSLGGALAALTMARLQMPMRPQDPLFEGQDPKTVQILNGDGTPRTVLQEMTARYNASHPLPSDSSCDKAHHSHFPFSIFHDIKHHHSDKPSHGRHKSHGSSSSSSSRRTDPDLILLRDCYSFASPKVGDTSFAQEFDKHHTQFLTRSGHRPVYYRVTVDKDLVPRMPPGCSTDPDEAKNSKLRRMFPCVQCSSSSEQHAEVTVQTSIHQKTVSYGATTTTTTTTTANGKTAQRQYTHHEAQTTTTTQKTQFRSLLDYRHVGQLVSLPNAPLRPTVKPSEFQTNLCSDVLRADQEMLQLLHQIESALKPNSASASDPSYMNKTQGKKTRPSFCAQSQADEMHKAKARHDLDQASRLRVPCDAERFLLTFPNVISHSPATYQRNLVRSRFYFSSFPGSEMESVIQEKRGETRGRCRDSAIVIDH